MYKNNAHIQGTLTIETTETHDLPTLYRQLTGVSQSMVYDDV